jgi:SAM-dependent methyltransferase
MTHEMATHERLAHSTPPAPRSAPCAHARGRTLYGGLLRECADCGLVATATVPDFDYEESYFTEDGSHRGYSFDSPLQVDRDAARFVPELEGLERQGLRGSVLDIGCATGAFLVHAQRRGWTVAGVEVAEYARAEAERRLGVPIPRELHELPAGARYDVVTLHHVLEHVHDPVGFLRDAVRPRVGRRLLVEVPNFECLARRAHGPRWRDLRPDQHVQHFTAQSLAAVATEAGYTPVRVYSLWEGLWTMRGGLEVMALLPALVRPLPEDTPPGGAPRATGDASLYKSPVGWRGVAASAVRLALRPTVRALEKARLGSRLVLEAEVARAAG